MSEQTLTQVEAPLLNPMQRVVNVFVAPSKTFEDVKRSSGWWVPFLIAVLVSALYAYVVLHKVGVPTLVDDAIRQSARQQDQIANSTPEGAAKIRRITGVAISYTLYALPVMLLVIGLAVAGLLLATANFGAGGKAKYKDMLAVWFYGAMPLTLFSLLVIAAILGGVVGDEFHMKNPIGTNIGFYMMGSELPKPLIAVLSAIDIFAIWTAFTLTIGVSTVAGIKRGAAAVVVCGWWFVLVLLQVAGAAFS